YGLDRIDPAKNVRIVLLEAAPRILPALPERLADSARRLLESLGIEVRTGARVECVTRDGVRLASGEEIPAELVVWSAGVKAPEFLKSFDGLEVNRINQLLVTPTLQTTRDADIFAIGDCASCPLPDKSGWVPPRAQAAHQQASHMIGQIKARLSGKPLRDYGYKDFGSLVSLGRYSTVGSLMGGLIGGNLFIEGLLARFIYRSLYQMHLAALHGRTVTLWRSLLSGLVDRPTPTVKLH
ncbi:MAG: NAD(P)/FAD-dependent oxidoreductase, partial [Steroidobacteraceae bacterium]